jgi:UDP-2-acetamido-2,6-beta-L-arabino-hexul-4-ose reductase
MKILITGAEGFIGRNLMAWLCRNPEHVVTGVDRNHTWNEIEAALLESDFVFHLAGINRPQSDSEFRTGNVDLTAQVCAVLQRRGQRIPILLSSSIQADLDNPYGISKREAEEVLAGYAETTGAPVLIYRLKNVFGKWSRPNYNSVVATFCHNIARDLPIAINDPERRLELVYIDDVAEQFAAELLISQQPGVTTRSVQPSYAITLHELAELLRSFRAMRQNLRTPDLGNPFVHKLYSTYLSYLPPDEFAYALDKKCDPRGCLAEFIKSPGFGQIFVSRTLPGITRGNHYHHTKTEKFLVLEGEAIVRFRPLDGDEVIEHPIRGSDFRVVDIPPGYTHSIENVGEGELITLFWADEIFDADRPDTYALPVLA